MTIICFQQLNWQPVAGATWWQIDDVTLVTISQYSQYLCHSQIII